MPAAANIVLADAQATPVNHTFVPLGPDAKDASKFWFEDQSAASPIGYWRISVTLKRPPPALVGNASDATRVCRAKVELFEPVLETVSNSTVSGIVPAPTLSYVPRSFTDIVMPERSSLQNRKDLRKMTAGALADTNVIAVIETLQSFW
jgi:hypothetical protein